MAKVTSLVLKMTLVLFLSIGVPLIFAFSPTAQEAASTSFIFIRERSFLGTAICVSAESFGILIGIPVSFMNVGVGVIYPLWKAYLVTLVACSFGVSGCYLLSRYFLSPEMRSAIADQLHIDLDAALHKGAWRFTILVWLINAPMCLKNYWLGSLSIPFRIYISVAMGNCLFMNLLHVFVGSQTSSLMEAWNKGEVKWYNVVVIVGAVLLSVVAGVMLARFIKANFSRSQRDEGIQFASLGETP